MTVKIHNYSITSLYLELLKDEEVIGNATGFITQDKGINYLVTNYHVVTGRHSETGEPIASKCDPQILRIHQNSVNKMGEWLPVDIALFDKDGKPLWIQHPAGHIVDVVLLPLPDNPGVKIYPVELTLAQVDIRILPSDDVSIIGFPYGAPKSGLCAVWKTGHVASDIDIDYDNEPIFIIDASTKPGMSGSPVFAIRRGTYSSSAGILFATPGEVSRFLGVYSGRLQDKMLADIGRVWKPKVITEILSRP